MIRFQTNVEYIIDWIGRMTKKHGSVVYERDRHQWWDWGQALCREQYGKEWNKLNLVDVTNDDILRAQTWENGEIPDWVDQERMILCGEESK